MKTRPVIVVTRGLVVESEVVAVLLLLELWRESKKEANHMNFEVLTHEIESLRAKLLSTTGNISTTFRERVTQHQLPLKSLMVISSLPFLSLSLSLLPSLWTWGRSCPAFYDEAFMPCAQERSVASQS